MVKIRAIYHESDVPGVGFEESKLFTNERTARAWLRELLGVTRLPPSVPTEQGIMIPLGEEASGEPWAELEYLE